VAINWLCQIYTISAGLWQNIISILTHFQTWNLLQFYATSLLWRVGKHMLVCARVHAHAWVCLCVCMCACTPPQKYCTHWLMLLKLYIIIMLVKPLLLLIFMVSLLLWVVQYHPLSTSMLQAQHTFLYFKCFWHVSAFMPFSRQKVSQVRIILVHNDPLLALKQ
jgi:hypothetical protein